MKVNLGSGKNYMQGYVNIDINPMWEPDVVADISEAFPIGYELWENCDEIVAQDVLEHIPDLIAAMTNCLNLLKEGGIMNISVPYDLSLGAWQDPTHVRAFNENSWLYYTDWFWYLGWNKHRFEMVKLDFVVNDKYLDGPLLKQHELLSTPRAIDSMHVILKKIPLSKADKETWRTYHAPR